MTPYEVEKCNALGRALPKLMKRVTGARGPKAETPAWDEAYFVREVVAKEWRCLRQQIADACEPWFK